MSTDEMTTDHRPQGGVEIGQHAVGRRLSAVGRVQLGSPDVRRPPDTGQQAGRSAHRVVTWTAHLLVPCFRWPAGDQHGDDNDCEEFCRHVRVQQSALVLRSSNFLSFWSPLTAAALPPLMETS
ncbi:hypothetical protein Q8A73_016291 [Channa argus]|nr:hypothetical protein Q8A73_016291 [Channa argus]